MAEQHELDVGEVTLAEALASGLAPPPEKWGRVLAAMVDIVAAHYVRKGRTEDESLAEAQEVIALLADYQGGRHLYLPRGDALRAALRDRVIYHRARRGNTAQLADEHNLTERRVQQIVAEQHAIRVRQSQGRFEGGAFDER